MGKFLSRAPQHGFTLIEAIMVIVITGIIGTMVAVFIRSPVEGYVDSVVRAELTDAADTALRRVARDVRSALPNSLRAATNGSTACIEFLPTVGGGRYRVAQSSAGGEDVLDFAVADNAFEVLASSNLPPPGGYGNAHQVVVYNLGIPGADAYAGNNRAAIAAGANAGTITLTAPFQFPFQSPGNRFHVIPNQSVIYTCDAGTGTLRRFTRAIAAAPPAACPVGAVGTALVNNVNCGASGFTYLPAEQRNGLLTMTLVLTQAAARGNETIRLYQEVHVDNTP